MKETKDKEVTGYKRTNPVSEREKLERERLKYWSYQYRRRNKISASCCVW